MATAIMEQPSAELHQITTTHQTTIVEEVCKLFDVTPDMLVRAPKEAFFWRKIAGLIAYLQDRDTKASFDIIALHIGDVPSSVPGHISFVSTRLAKEDPEIIDLLTNLVDPILDRIGDDKLLWQPTPKSPQKSTCTKLATPAKSTLAIREAVAKSSEIRNNELEGGAQLHHVVRARDVVLLLFTVHLGLKKTVAGRELKRSPKDVDWALKRMANPDSRRVDILSKACRELGLDPRSIMSKAGFV